MVSKIHCDLRQYRFMGLLQNLRVNKIVGVALKVFSLITFGLGVLFGIRGKQLLASACFVVSGLGLVANVFLKRCRGLPPPPPQPPPPRPVVAPLPKKPPKEVPISERVRVFLQAHPDFVSSISFQTIKEQLPEVSAEDLVKFYIERRVFEGRERWTIEEETFGEMLSGGDYIGGVSEDQVGKGYKMLGEMIRSLLSKRNDHIEREPRVVALKTYMPKGNGMKTFTEILAAREDLPLDKAKQLLEYYLRFLTSKGFIFRFYNKEYRVPFQKLEVHYLVL